MSSQYDSFLYSKYLSQIKNCHTRSAGFVIQPNGEKYDASIKVYRDTLATMAYAEEKGITTRMAEGIKKDGKKCKNYSFPFCSFKQKQILIIVIFLL
ncbi:hypothetical protein [Bacteroides sp.]|uniref:hypothetical protein n=1 Tax=Bacteroides sp. TaxID=29523 RepID=UPI002614191D|nr:hypothetical protein [Bacteroides sp.]